MKKIFTLILAAATCGQLFAGGIVTNTNQSAQFVRMLSRNASTQIDAVYFNPAGVVRMDDGFHFSLHNQTIFQTKTVTTTFPLNNKEFVGDVKAPLFPSFFAVYKKDKLAVSFGFGPNGGGGSAEYAGGLPSFEMLVSQIPGQMTAAGIATDAYDADIYFDGSSVYWGSQLNASYQINDMLSVAAGVRMINAKNNYQGYIKNIMVNPMHPLNTAGAGNLVSAPAFFGVMSAASYQAAGTVDQLHNNGIPSLEYARDNAIITADQYNQLVGGLGANYVEGMALTTVSAMYNGSGALADQYAAATSDIEVETTQTGMAFTPIFSAQFSPNDKLDIAIKYELNTSLTLTNDTKKDYADMFKHDSSFRADIPAILAIGVGYKISDKFRTQVSFNTYFDKQANWEGREDLVDKNLWEASLGLEYDINDMFTASIGFMRGVTGVRDQYQTDLSYSNSSTTVGLGVQIKPMENLSIDLGGLYVMYDDHSVDYLTGTPYAYNMNYAKTTTTFGIGVNYKF
ncbi:MAG: OmpP1/FadL family transporter [Salinivirgaceae bacterium]